MPTTVLKTFETKSANMHRSNDGAELYLNTMNSSDLRVILVQKF